MKKLTFDIYIISRLTHIYYTRELRKIGLSFGEFPFLISVYENEGISQEELSSLLIISKSTTAMMIRKLAEAGYVRKEVDPDDKRNFRLYITDEGLKFIPAIRRIIDALRKRGYAKLLLYTDQANCKAQACYRKCGFMTTELLTEEMSNGKTVARCKMELVLNNI